MNAERLLALYEKVAEAPDAIGRLRGFVLDLAVRGKLVEQNPNDVPASELLKRIAAEKARLAKLGETRERRNAIEINRDDLPFIPGSHWVWCRLIDLARASYGFAFKSAQFNDKKRGMPLIRIRDISKTDTEAYYEGEYDPAYLVRAGDYLVGMDGDFNLRRWQGPDGLLNQRVMRVNGWRCDVEPEFVKLPLQMVLYHLHRDTSQTTVKHLSAKQVNSIEIPLPPLAEQRRIVAKVNELMALLDRLEAARTAREATRDRLSAASLACLVAPGTTPEVGPAHARFALDALPALTARRGQIKALRQTILNLAVQGKLVDQDPNDEPASELLKRISVEKARLAKAGEIRKQKPVGQILEEHHWFTAPSSWRWVPLGGVGLTQTGTSPSSSKPELFGDFIPFVKPADLDGGSIKYDGPGLSRKGIGHSRVAPAHSVMMVCIGATLGKVNVTDLEVCFNQQINSLRPFINGMHRFVALALKSSFFQGRAWARAGTGTLPIISKGKWEVLPIPLPPLAEQHRIVAKVDELMALCDRLEAALATTDTTKQRLLEALLHEALEPTLKEAA